MLTEKMRALIEDVCRLGQGPFDTAFFEKHIQVVASIADMLAQKYHADREVVALAAYLHDISAVEDYTSVARHHILGGERAEEILSFHGYPAEKIAAVRQCILTHSSPVAVGQGTLEEVCISNAEAASRILTPGYWLHYGYTAKGLDYQKGLAWYTDMIDSHWSRMTEEARTIAAESYHATKTLFDREANPSL